MGHWYNKKGEPVYEVPCSTKDGNRPTTIKDARKLDLVPSVTGIIDMASKDALITWKINQVLDAAWKFRQTRIEEAQWKGMVRKQSQKISEDSAKLGNKIHNGLECRLQGRDAADKQTDEYDKYIDPVINLLGDNDLLGGCAEKSFSYKDGFGGKVDYHHNFNGGFVLDFKTKDKEWADKDQLAYDGHCMQLAAYREGLGMPNAKCYNLFISTKKPGLVRLHEWTEAEMQRGWKMFKCLLEYWKLVNKFG